MIFLCISRWVGVSGSTSFGSSAFAVRAPPLRIRSTSVRSVRRTTSVTVSAPKMDYKTGFALRTIRSHTPDILDAVGG